MHRSAAHPQLLPLYRCQHSHMGPPCCRSLSFLDPRPRGHPCSGLPICTSQYLQPVPRLSAVGSELRFVIQAPFCHWPLHQSRAYQKEAQTRPSTQIVRHARRYQGAGVAQPPLDDGLTAPPSVVIVNSAEGWADDRDDLTGDGVTDTRHGAESRA